MIVNRHKISAATFIRDTISGAFCLFESMASWLPLVDDMTIIDVGSTDGTLELLQDIAAANPRISVVKSQFSKIDAGAFADIANDCVAQWKHDSGIFWQADEIPHQDLLLRLNDHLHRGLWDHTFWRYQLQENWQVMKWPPHPVHRLGCRLDGRFNFVGDGMNTDRYFDPSVCSEYDGGWFIRWGDAYIGRYPELPTHDMIMDVSASGGFLENIIRKRQLHAPMWHENPNVDGKPVDVWVQEQRNNPNWSKTESPFDIPHIMKWHVSRPTYDVREELVEALKTDNTWRLVCP